MKIKVGNTIYDSEEQPVMVILTDQDKININNMLPTATRYCVYPATDFWMENNYKRIKEWMEADIDTEFVDEYSLE